jgi:hypothetical protein
VVSRTVGGRSVRGAAPVRGSADGALGAIAAATPVPAGRLSRTAAARAPPIPRSA